MIGLQRKLGALLVPATVAALLATGAPAAAAPTHPALVATAHSQQQPTNPYGNPFNDYLRQPFGVMSSAQEQRSLAPVADNPSEPFDWYRSPRAALGVYGGPEESIVTPEGDLQTAFGTLTFYTGANKTPVDQRVKTWKDGYLPILEDHFTRDGVQNSFEYFAADVPGVAKLPYAEVYGVPSRTDTTDVDNMVNFTKVTFTNTSDTATTYPFSVDLGTDKIAKPHGNISGTTWNPGPAAPADAAWNSDEKAFVGDGKLLYTASANPASVTDSLNYQLQLAPGQTTSLVFTMPYWVAQESDLQPIRSADYDTELSETAAFWHKTLDDAGTSIDLPGDGVESKVLDTYKASLALSLIDVDLTGGKCFWDANPTVYDNYYLRDAAFDLDGLLDAGFTDLARRCTLAMLDWQQDDGQFISQSGENDGNGEALWMFGDYYQRTHDADFARQVYPAVQRAMAWEWQARQADWASSGGLFPSSSMTDNEHVTGHVLTYDLWNIAGEAGAAETARAAGDDATAQTWQQRHDQYVHILRDKLQPAVSQLGWIPPAVEGMQAKGTSDGWYGPNYGIDWGNLEAVWPSGAFAPDDPWVTQSLRAWEGKMFEGVFTWPNGGRESSLHSYTPISILDTYVRDGEQDNAITGLYDLLVHTSATDAAGEVLDAAERSPANEQTLPHGEFAGKYLTLLRDMLAYEGQDGALHLANSWSPVWAQPGQRIGFSGDTDFGHVAYRIDVHRDGAVVHLTPPTRAAPKDIVISAPSDAKITRVTGAPGARARGNTITLSPLDGPVTLHVIWHRPGRAPSYSFARAVQDYEADYRKMTEAPDVAVEHMRADTRTTRDGDPLTVRADVVNRGGAGYLDDPGIVLYVDGSPVQTDSTTLARGIGFTTPDGIISFDRNTEGMIPVSFTPQVCGTGTHTIGIGLGTSPPAQTVRVTVRPRPPSAPAPSADLSLRADPDYVATGGQATLTATVTDSGCQAIGDVKADLSAPDGWTVSPTSPTTVDTVAPGDSATITWQATAPNDTGGEPTVQAPFHVTTSYSWSGTTTGSAAADTDLHVLSPVQPPYRTYKSTDAYFGQAGDKFAIAAGGRDLGTSRDEFGAIYLPHAGTPSTTVTTTVTGQGDTWPWAKAGLMMRNDLSTGGSAGYAAVAITPGNGVQFLWDSDGNGTLNKNAHAGSTHYPVQLKLERSGSTFTGYYSTDGSSWTEVGSGTAPNTTTTGDVGMFATAVNSYVPGAISQATFDGMTVTHPAASSLADAYNNIGITDDSDPSPGNFDGGNSFSAQALADQGLTPGTAVNHDGLSFTWPDVPVGTADNVAGSAAIQLSGTGHTLGFLGSAVHDQTGSGAVVYTDGSVQDYTAYFPNYAGRVAPTQGAEVVADCDYRNTPAGPANYGYGYRIFYQSVPLDPDKTVAQVILPDNPQIHVFALGVG